MTRIFSLDFMTIVTKLLVIFTAALLMAQVSNIGAFLWTCGAMLMFLED